MKKIKFKWEYILVGVGVLVFFLIKNNVKRETENIFENGNYTIGQVIRYDPGSSYNRNIFGSRSSMSSAVTYTYKVNGQLYEQLLSSMNFNINDENIRINQNYLVVYLEEDPEKSRILIEKSINDSLDFKNYVMEMKNKRD